MSEEQNIFELGKPIPKVWLHMEFDIADTLLYARDETIKSIEELMRIESKYLGKKA